MNDPTAIVAEDAGPLTSPPVPEEVATLPGANPSGTPDPILAMIERAARDPTVVIEKFERLMAMKERVETQRASIAFAEAFAELGPDLPTIDRNGQIIVYSKADRDKLGGVPPDATPIQKTRYATIDDILAALREPLHRHGFTPVRFEHTTLPDGRVETTAILRHRTGHEEKATIPPLKHDTTGSKNDVQAIGSALTYGRRYALMAVLPIVSHAPQDADDDGRAAGSALIDADQLAELQQLLQETKSDLAIFFDTLGAIGFSDITVKQFKRGKALLEEKKRRAAKAKTP